MRARSRQTARDAQTPKQARVTLYATVALATTGAVLALWAADVLRSARTSRPSTRASRSAASTRRPTSSSSAIDTRTNSRRSRGSRSAARTTRASSTACAGPGARAIVYDVQFTEPSADDAADNALIDAVDARAADRAGTSEVGERRRDERLRRRRRAREIGARAGERNLPNDPGGIVRRLAYDESRAARRCRSSRPSCCAGGRSCARATSSPTAPRGSTSPARRAASARVSFGDVELGRVDARDVRGKAVVVGATAPVAEGRLPGLDVDRRPHGRARDPGGGDPDGARRLPAAQRAGLAGRAADRRLGLLGAAHDRCGFGPQRAALLGVAVGARCSRASRSSRSTAALIVSVLYPLVALGLGVRRRARRRDRPSARSSASACATSSRASCPRPSSTTSSRAPRTTCASAASARS